MRILLSLSAFIALSSVSAADLFIIDAAGGPGADFLSLAGAVAAPQVKDGDTLLVRSGEYSGFDTHKALSILEGDGQDATVTSTITIHDIGGGSWFSFEGIDFERLHLSQCTSTVFVRGAIGIGVRVLQCSDVRIREVAIFAPEGFNWPNEPGDGEDAVEVSGNSKVELVECVLQGGKGEEGYYTNWGGDGGQGLSVTGQSSAHIALSEVTGGDGGDNPDGWGFSSGGGDGGHGIYNSLTAELIVSGLPSNQIRGGMGGDDGAGQHSWHGSGLYNWGAARISGAMLFDLYDVGYLEQPADPDPVLTTQPSPGGALRVEIHGAPGAAVRLAMGSWPMRYPAGTLVTPVMLKPRKTVWVGVIGATGNITHVLEAGITQPFGHRSLRLLQASATLGGQATRTNSMR